MEDEQVDIHTTKYVLRVKDEAKFDCIIRDLEQVEGLDVTLELNSLEEAFLAILHDPEILNGRDAVSLTNAFEERS